MWNITTSNYIACNAQSITYCTDIMFLEHRIKISYGRYSGKPNLKKITYVQSLLYTITKNRGLPAFPLDLRK
ncbi:hypothetical protein Avbf_04831 [Armadillidium vulgare]|nr:hypothetical protein Avbf_04831 [Armadillidium vulgare]